MRNLVSIILALILLAVGTTGPALAQSGADLLEEVQARYESIDGIQSRFVQTVESEFASARRTEGTLYLAGARYRVETDQQTFVTDGSTTWIYSPAQKQVIINRASDDGSDLTPQTFFTDYAARYAVDTSRDTTVAGTAFTVLDLKPSVPEASFDHVRLWVNPVSRIIERLRVRDANGSVITIRLRDISVNPGLSDTTFRFDPPEDVEIVDLRSS
ncbi:LolA family protein [Longibacter sp.]|uniref:LolA family protein n=1 Tax=Longibacter sp. TaxID=2045415 RepID=UPI003EBFBED0